MCKPKDFKSEISAMKKITKALEPLDQAGIDRVLRWVSEYFLKDQKNNA